MHEFGLHATAKKSLHATYSNTELNHGRTEPHTTSDCPLYLAPRHLILVVTGGLKFENRTRQTVVPSIYARIPAQQKTHHWLKKKNQPSFAYSDKRNRTPDCLRTVGKGWVSRRGRVALRNIRASFPTQHPRPDLDCRDRFEFKFELADSLSLNIHLSCSPRK
jgi:hypothetical protein